MVLMRVTAMALQVAGMCPCSLIPCPSAVQPQGLVLPDIPRGGKDTVLTPMALVSPSGVNLSWPTMRQSRVGQLSLLHLFSSPDDSQGGSVSASPKNPGNFEPAKNLKNFNCKRRAKLFVYLYMPAIMIDPFSWAYIFLYVKNYEKRSRLWKLFIDKKSKRKPITRYTKNP
jgi:hypothetical protein